MGLEESNNRQKFTKKTQNNILSQYLLQLALSGVGVGRYDILPGSGT